MIRRVRETRVNRQLLIFGFPEWWNGGEREGKRERKGRGSGSVHTYI